MACRFLGALALAMIVSPVIAQNASVVPMQMRFAYAGDTGVYMSWNTFSQLSNPTVKYGLSPNVLNMTASSNVSVTYQSSTTYNNHVKITGLQPATLYYYQPQFSSASTPYSFKTSTPAGNGSAYSIAVVVDLGLIGPQGLSTTVGKGAASPLKVGESNTIASLQQDNNFEFLWHPGDIAYADYWLKEEIQGFLPNTTIADGYKVYESLLNQFYDQMTPITSQKAYMVGPGNHEANCDNGGTTDPNTNIAYNSSICVPGQTNFTGYINHFRMPANESGGLGNFWYSFDYGMTHFVQIDTETDLGHGFVSPDEPGGPENENSGPFATLANQQTDWLSKDLAAVNRTKTPWIVVSGHRPWYVSYQNKSSAICTECKDVFEPLFYQYGVDLVLSGHIHYSERNDPMYLAVSDPNGLNNPKAPWYITNGAAGHYDGLDPLLLPLPSWARYAQNSTYSWSRLTFHNCTHLTHDFVASANGSILDTATLFKNRTCGLSKSTTTTGSSASPTATGSASMMSLPMSLLVTLSLFIGLLMN